MRIPKAIPQRTPLHSGHRAQLRDAGETPASKRSDDQKQLLTKHPSANISTGVLYQYLPEAAEDLKKYDARIAEVRKKIRKSSLSEHSLNHPVTFPRPGFSIEVTTSSQSSTSPPQLSVWPARTDAQQRFPSTTKHFRQPVDAWRSRAGSPAATIRCLPESSSIASGCTVSKSDWFPHRPISGSLAPNHRTRKFWTDWRTNSCRMAGASSNCTARS